MAHDQMVKKMATEKLDANNDLVKMLNSLGARAAAFTIRDKQASFDHHFPLFILTRESRPFVRLKSTGTTTMQSAKCLCPSYGG